MAGIFAGEGEARGAMARAVAREWKVLLITNILRTGKRNESRWWCFSLDGGSVCFRKSRRKRIGVGSEVGEV